MVMVTILVVMMIRAMPINNEVDLDNNSNEVNS